MVDVGVGKNIESWLQSEGFDTVAIIYSNGTLKHYGKPEGFCLSGIYSEVLLYLFNRSYIFCPLCLYLFFVYRAEINNASIKQRTLRLFPIPKLKRREAVRACPERSRRGESELWLFSIEDVSLVALTGSS